MTLHSLFIGRRGIDAHQMAINTTTNNIANVNSIAFKGSKIGFENAIPDIKSIGSGPNGALGSTNPKALGGGVQAANIRTDFSQGSLRNVREQSKLGLEGPGMFVLSSNGEVDNGQITDTVFTRDGNFSIDADGHLVNNKGQFVMGAIFYNESTEEMKSINSPDYTTVNYVSNQAIGSSIEPQVSPSFSINSIGAADIDTTNISELSIRSGMSDKSVSISDGTFEVSQDRELMTFTFTETSGDFEPPADVFKADVNPSLIFENKSITFDLTNGTGQTLQFRIRVAPEVTKLSEIFTGFVFDKDLGIGSSLTFDSASNSTTTQVGNSVTLAADDMPFISPSDLGGLLAPIKMPPIFYSFNPNSEITLSSYLIGTDGSVEIEGKESTGRMAIGQILMSNFNNYEGLVNKGEGLYVTSSNSGAASLQLLGGVSQNPNLALEQTRMISSTLEFSNVDVGAELTKMVAYQRGLQGSARVVTVADELMQVLLQL
ncbi:MAG: flagellar hook-basal body complex protein [Candidatus Caenarcaniphilales bacterium]|nr:flagellar hook-basal body complex protein [Candidatus Caenarcaniphilales bacterium]